MKVSAFEMDYSKYAFIFDMDGTLVDNMHHHTRAWGVLLEENGIEMDPHHFLVQTAGKTNREIMPMVFGDITDTRLEELTVRKETLYRESFLPERKLVDGLAEFLGRASDLGIKMAVATAATKRNVEFILDGLDIRRLFGAVVTAADVKRGKPDPEIFLKSAELLGVPPSGCIVFEDAIGGFQAAHNARMKSIGIATVNPVDEILGYDSVVDAAADFTGFDPDGLVARHLV
jgi:beta-phosphoglucomutase family hydrolase